MNSRLNAIALKPGTKCVLCTCKLDAAEGDDLEHELCAACKDRPEARRLGVLPARSTHKPGDDPPPRRPARDITPAERSLIAKLHGCMPAQQLLDILNERLIWDLGPDVQPHTLEQLYQEIAAFGGSVDAGAGDWAGLRKLLAQARRSGVLNQITEQMIKDFAVVYSLNAKQLMTLKDILLQAKEDQ